VTVTFRSGPSTQLRTAVVILAALGGHRLLPAQEPAAAAEQIVVRVLGHEDGLPRPGVLLHLASADPGRPRVDADGWLVAEDERISRLRAATTVRTDPNGCARVDGSIAAAARRVSVGEPHYLWGEPERDSGALVVRVGEHEPVGVRVVDANGRPMAGFPVALHAAGKDLAVALTDADGKALLGVPKDFTARIAVVPAGWVGPKGGFPSIAESLAGRRSAVLTVPEFGSLGIRAVRCGVPVRLPAHGVSFFDPKTYEPLSAQPSVNAGEVIGIRFDRVALGVGLAAYSPFPSGGLIEAVGPQRAGELEVLDVDFGPRLSFRLAGAAREQIDGNVQVRVISDAGSHTAHASRSGEGQVVDFHQALPGSRLVRVEFDAVVPAAGNRRAVVWSLAMPCDRAIAPSIDLGEVALDAHAPQLRGTVVDDAGAAVAGATVVVSTREESGYQLTTDAEGRFEFTGPMLRDANGALAGLVAEARHGDRRSARSAPIEAGGEVTLTVRAVIPVAAAKDAPPPRGRTEARGRLVASIVGIAADYAARQNIWLVAANGRQHYPTAANVGADGLTELVFERLPAGCYALHARRPDLGQFIALDGIDVPAEGACADERLHRVGLLDRLRTTTVRVVDDQGVPVAGARLVGPEIARETDGTGTLRLLWNRDATLQATIGAPGKRTQRLSALADDLVVKLEPAGTIAVTVRGLPDDVPRDRLEVWVRDEVRERMSGPQVPVGADGVARAELPARGRYVLWLLVTRHDDHVGSTASGVFIDPVPIVIGDAREQQAELKLDEAAVKRLREAVAQWPAPPRK